MSLITLDDFSKFDNHKDIKIPGIETTWSIVFNDAFRAKASYIASKVEKLYQKQTDDSYDQKLLAMSDAKRREVIEKDLAEYRDACVSGINELLNDGKAGTQIYDAFGQSTEVLAQIIGKLNDECDKALNVSEQQSQARMARYDTDR